MPETSPYAYAKACGIIGKSFTGKRINCLYGLYSLKELDRLIFPDHFSDLTAKELLPDLENRITMRAVSQIFAIVDSYSKPPKIVEQMLRSYEYGDFKKCINEIVSGKTNAPAICNIGRFGKINFNAFPDLKKMLKDTEFEYLLKEDLQSISHNTDTLAVEKKIDYHFYQELAHGLDELSDEDHRIIQHFLTDEISLKNCSYALRLRAYYHKNDEDIEKLLLDFRIRGKKKGALALEAVQSLKFPLDSRYQWDNWKWEDLLNPEEPLMNWTLDPRYFQNAASIYMYKLAGKYFRRNPMAVSSIYCFIKLIQFEEDVLTSIAEGLALGMDSNTVFSLLEVNP